MTRIAVTGATGALGSRAARGVLARLDEQVAALDGAAATSHGAAADARGRRRGALTCGSGREGAAEVFCGISPASAVESDENGR